MRIGILAPPYPGGGIYQYGLTVLQALRVLSARTGLVDSVVVFAPPGTPVEAVVSGAPNVRVLPATPPELRASMRTRIGTLLGNGRVRQTWWKLKQRVARSEQLDPLVQAHTASKLTRWYRDAGVDLMIYPYDAELALAVEIPYMVAMHDLAHRLIPEFPEISDGGEWEKSERLRRNACVNSQFILVDSEVGRQDILNAYGPWGVTAERIRILPFVPPPYLRTQVAASEIRALRDKYGLPERYLFYPADFSRHKNHAQLIRALGMIREEQGVAIPVVFCGYHADLQRTAWLNELKRLARRHGLGGQARFLGYVSNDEICSLYAGATALVMPTYCGPTVIPVLEAWATQCPVVTSNIPGIREQVGDAGVLVDPRSVESIATAIQQVWRSEPLRRSLAEKGQERLRKHNFESFCAGLAAVIAEAQP